MCGHTSDVTDSISLILLLIFCFSPFSWYITSHIKVKYLRKRGKGRGERERERLMELFWVVSLFLFYLFLLIRERRSRRILDFEVGFSILWHGFCLLIDSVFFTTFFFSFFWSCFCFLNFLEQFYHVSLTGSFHSCSIDCQIYNGFCLSILILYFFSLVFKKACHSTDVFFEFFNILKECLLVFHWIFPFFCNADSEKWLDQMRIIRLWTGPYIAKVICILNPSHTHLSTYLYISTDWKVKT